MRPATPIPPEYRYTLQAAHRTRFYGQLILQTLSGRSFPALIESRLGMARLHWIDGLPNLPPSGPFVLAANHYKGAHTYDVIAAVLASAALARRDALTDTFVVLGRGERRVPPVVRAGLDAFFARWSHHAHPIGWARDGDTANTLRGLRDWRRRQQPALVFPEGVARLMLGAVRKGTGRWLAAFNQPVIPVGVWWYAPNRARAGWRVRFGTPIQWVARPDAYDLQLGLAMAALLPPALAPQWQGGIAAWRAAHAKRDS